VRADQLAQIGRQIGDDLRAELGPLVTAALRDAGAGRVTERPAADLVPAGSAGRTQLASLSQHRYDRLPENERALRSPESDVAVQRYFQGMIRKDHSMMLDALEITEGIGGVRAERAALAEGVAATGGNLVPTPLAASIVEKRQDVEVIGPRSRRFTSQNQSIAIPTQATLMTAALTAEGAAIAATDPTFGQVVLSKKKIATATRSSRELLDDSPFDLFGRDLGRHTHDQR
jgi:HK97 family phage major capsid protein